MTVISEIEWDACLIEPRRDDEYERRYRQETGRPASGARYVAGVPWLAEVLIDWAVEVERRVVVDAELADLVGLVVSQDNSCRYCFATMRFFLIVLGVPDAKIRRLEEQLLSVDFSPEQRAALDFARRVSRSDPLPTPADLQTLRTHGYSDLEVAELVAVVGIHLFFNRLSTLIADASAPKMRPQACSPRMGSTEPRSIGFSRISHRRSSTRSRSWRFPSRVRRSGTSRCRSSGAVAR
jgi:hypothetical protein